MFRTNLPISPTVHDFHSAADGQLGGIMKVYREWRIMGDINWLKMMYPAVKKVWIIVSVLGIRERLELLKNLTIIRMI